MKRKIMGILLLVSGGALVRADVEVKSEQGSKTSQTVGVIELRNDTKDDFGIAVVIPNKGRAIFVESQRLTPSEKLYGRLKGKGYLRITDTIGAPQKGRTEKTANPINVKDWFKIDIYDLKTKKTTTNKISDNSTRKNIALVVERDKDGVVHVRAQKGNKAKGLFTGSGSSSGVNLFGNVTGGDIKKQQ